MFKTKPVGSLELKSVSKIDNNIETIYGQGNCGFGADNSSQTVDVNCEENNEKEFVKIELGFVPLKRLIYRLTDTPPVHFLILFAIQQACLAISTPLGTTAIVAEGVCAAGEESLKVKILSSTMLMMGLSTFCMTTFGVRLPIFQGPSPGYIIPLIAMMNLPEFKCPETFKAVDPRTNETVLMARIDNETVVRNYDVATGRINAYAGSLMLAGGLHFLVGITGLVGVIARYVGPITIVPVVTLFGIYIHGVVVSFAETNWIVAVITAGTCLVLALFLEKRSTPIPMWTPRRGFHIIWQPLHQIFALLISILLGWLISYIMTEFDALSDDPNSKEYDARTDTKLDTITDTDWFLFPYPGQFGMPSFSVGALVTFLISTILSVLDSIADYNATAKVAYVPSPPTYALNRGIAVEGIMSILSGSLGCGHATVSYGENIGAMGISKVASRSVFQVVGLIYIVCAILGKVGAFFITIPYAVIGGSQIITFGILIGVILSYLQLIDLNSTRNMSIIGIAILLGMMMPFWTGNNPDAISTGNIDLDNVIKLCLSNPSFIGGFFACVMDNAVPGTLQERGILVQLKELDEGEKNNPEEDGGDDSLKKNDFDENVYENGLDVYRLPWLPESFRKTFIARFLPIFEFTKPDQKVE